MIVKLKFNDICTYIGYTAFAFSVALVFNTKLANLCLVFLYILGLTNYITKSNISFKGDNLNILKYSVLLLLLSTLLSFFFSHNIENVLKAFGRRSSYFFTPLFFLLFDKKTINLIKKKSFKGILLGSTASSLFLIANIFYEYYLTRPIFSINKEIFNFYHTSGYFTRIIDIHPSYYGMYILLALVYLYFEKKRRHISLSVFIFFVLTMAVIFIASRIIILLYMLLSIFFIIYNIYVRNKIGNLYKALILSNLILIISLFFFILLKKTYAYQRIVKESSWELSYEIGTNYNYKGSGDSRLARWNAALHVIKASPFCGYGVFNERKVLVKQYSKMKMYSAAKLNYNSHNQYLGFFIEGGVFSIIALLVYFSYNIFLSLKNKNIIGVCFFISIVFVCLVENYLIRNAGIIYISFFGTLFLYENNYND